MKKIFNDTVNVKLMVENIIKIKIAVMINVEVRVKTQWNIEYVKKMILGTLVHVLVGLISI